MADDSAHISKTLDDIKAQIAAKIADAARLLPTANHLAEMIDAPLVTLSDFIGEYEEISGSAVPSSAAAGRPGVPGASRSGSSRHIKPDTFLGQPPLDAAKKYIGMVGHAAHMDDISGAVERGGAAIKGADWREKLEMGLLRSTHDVVKVQDKTYGLVAFYTPAQIEGLRGVRRREKPKPKRKAREKEKTPKASKGPMPIAKPKAAKAEASDALKVEPLTTPEPVH